jgi:hypothetical protein
VTNSIGFKREPEGAFYLRLRGSYGTTQPQLSHPSATGTEDHRPRDIRQGFSPLHRMDREQMASQTKW